MSGNGIGARDAAAVPPDWAARALTAVRVLHTLVWALFAGCIVAIPIASALGRHAVAAVLAAIVAGEVIVLVGNGFRCPLTALAARYTDDRRANFDICLPEWLARHNQAIFGTLYVVGSAFALARWLLASG
ncbi:MAG: hypothetical protein IPI27_10340 [Betaproteobacteria bacterium]|nr:hypothetical protein [Betaproteobacteria bacterium]